MILFHWNLISSIIFMYLRLFCFMLRTFESGVKSFDFECLCNKLSKDTSDFVLWKPLPLASNAEHRKSINTRQLSLKFFYFSNSFIYLDFIRLSSSKSLTRFSCKSVFSFSISWHFLVSSAISSSFEDIFRLSSSTVLLR